MARLRLPGSRLAPCVSIALPLSQSTLEYRRVHCGENSFAADWMPSDLLKPPLDSTFACGWVGNGPFSGPMMCQALSPSLAHARSLCRQPVFCLSISPLYAIVGTPSIKCIIGGSYMWAKASFPLGRLHLLVWNTFRKSAVLREPGTRRAATQTHRKVRRDAIAARP